MRRGVDRREHVHALDVARGLQRRSALQRHAHDHSRQRRHDLSAHDATLRRRHRLQRLLTATGRHREGKNGGMEEVRCVGRREAQRVLAGDQRLRERGEESPPDGRGSARRPSQRSPR